MAEQVHDMAHRQWRCNNKYQVLCSASVCWQVILDATRSAQSLCQRFKLLTPYNWFWEEVYGCGEHAVGNECPDHYTRRCTVLQGGRSVRCDSSTYGSIKALLQHELQHHTLHIFSTKCCIIIRQEQLLTLRAAGQRVSHNVQWPFTVHNDDGQFIHMFQPSGLATTQISLHSNIYPWLMISLNCCVYSIDVTPPFNT